MESSRTSLASRTHFQVLGLEASIPQKLPCPRLEDSSYFFEWLKFCRSAEKCFSRPFFFWRSTEKKFLRPFFRKTLAFVSLVLGLGSSIPVLGLGLGFFLCPWPWPRAFCPRLHLCCNSKSIFSLKLRRN